MLLFYLDITFSLYQYTSQKLHIRATSFFHHLPQLFLVPQRICESAILIIARRDAFNIVNDILEKMSASSNTAWVVKLNVNIVNMEMVVGWLIMNIDFHLSWTNSISLSNGSLCR